MRIYEWSILNIIIHLQGENCSAGSNNAERKASNITTAESSDTTSFSDQSLVAANAKI